MRNVRSPLAQWRMGCPMVAHDALPAPLRLWLKEAVLPWSAVSARRVWEREVKRSGVEGALRRLAEVEAATLAKEAKSDADFAAISARRDRVAAGGMQEFATNSGAVSASETASAGQHVARPRVVAASPVPSGQGAGNGP